MEVIFSPKALEVDDFINITTIKTKSRVNIPLIPESQAILNRYRNIIGTRALPVLAIKK